jgi:repressor LexA
MKQQKERRHAMKKTDQITPVQAETLAFIAGYIARHGYSPTVAEMAGAADVCHTQYPERLASMMRKGAITKMPGIARSICPA